ncbi:MAG: flagellar basal body-associated FliL family protein [Myxococcales bacterium]|nr:flagellar basal body-associated FliL family protein [Myxococcales bacterium]
MATAATAEETEKPKRSLLVIALVALNVLAISGVGIYFFLLREPDAVEEEVPAEPPPPGEFGPLLEMRPIVANLNDGARGRYLRVALHLEVSNELDSPAVEAALVPVRNRFLIFLSNLTVDEASGAVNKERIREELAELANEVLGSERVRRIFFTEFVVQ